MPTKPDAPRGISVWNDLSELKELFVEACEVPPNNTRLRRTHEGWVSFQSFYARLVAKGIPLDERPASKLMKQALEDPLPPEPQRSHAYIRVACEWIIAAGQHLFSRVRDTETIFAQASAEWPCEQGAIPRERWEVWRNSLKVLCRGLKSDQRSLQDKLFEAGNRMNSVQCQHMRDELDQKDREYEEFRASILEQREDVNKWLGGV